MRRYDDDAAKEEAEGRLPSPGDRPMAVESRSDRLQRIRAEIARGEYDTPERFEAACERMFATLASSE